MNEGFKTFSEDPCGNNFYSTIYLYAPGAYRGDNSRKPQSRHSQSGYEGLSYFERDAHRLCITGENSGYGLDRDRKTGAYPL